MDERAILVLGASGFLGAHLVRAFLEAGARVVAAARRPEAIPFAPGAAVERRAWDALEAGGSVRLLDEVRPRAVVSAMALAKIEDCERYPGLARALNAELPGALARLAEERGARFVHLSTDLVFGGASPNGERYAEGDPPSPLHEYGRSKAAGEERVLAVSGTLVVRLPLLHGTDLAGRGRGASAAILAAVERGERPVLFRDEWRTPLEAGNAARAVLELLGSDASGLLHVAGPERLSRHELGLLVLESIGRSSADALDVLRSATRAELGLEHVRARDVSLDASRARARLATRLLGPREALSGQRSRSNQAWNV